MQHCQGSKKSKRFLPGSDFTHQIFTGEFSGVDSAGILRQGVNMNKSTSPAVKTYWAITFYSEVFKCIDTHELHYQFHGGYNEIVLQIDEFQLNGSG